MRHLAQGFSKPTSCENVKDVNYMLFVVTEVFTQIYLLSKQCAMIYRLCLDISSKKSPKTTNKVSSLLLKGSPQTAKKLNSSNKNPKTTNKILLKNPRMYKHNHCLNNLNEYFISPLSLYLKFSTKSEFTDSMMLKTYQSYDTRHIIYRLSFGIFHITPTSASHTHINPWG